VAIHFTSNRPYEHKIAAFRFLVTRMQRLPLTPQYKQKEWRNILHVSKTNGYPLSTITKLNTQIQNKLHNLSVTNEHSNKKWTTFRYHSPMIGKMTIVFHDTNLKLAFRTKNSIQNILNTQNQNKNKYTYSSIYQMICHICSNSYIGQTDRGLEIRYKEHIRHIKNNSSQSAYTHHVLLNRHNYGPMETTVTLLHKAKKVKRMNTLENYYIQFFQHNNTVINEHSHLRTNPLFQLACDANIEPPTAHPH
jgi:hypothetical protein